MMRERASRVELQPDLEDACRSFLAEKCSHDTQVRRLCLLLRRKCVLVAWRGAQLFI